MNRQKVINIFLVGILTLLTSCVESTEREVSHPGKMCLQLTAGDLAVRTRAEGEENPEFYMGKTYFFFYKKDAKEEDEPLYYCDYSVNEYHTKQIVLDFSEAVGDKLFDSSNECVAYAVANLPTDVKVGEMSSHSRKALKQLVPVTLVNGNTLKDGDFAMDGECIITRDSTDKSMTGTMLLERALAKVSLSLKVAQEVTLDNGKSYVSADGVKSVTLYHSVSSGILNGVADDRTFLDQTHSLDTEGRTEDSYTSDSVEIKCWSYTCPDFYTYPNRWASNFDEEQETSLTLQVGWKETDAANYVTYYYQIPINMDGMELERNHHYLITLKVGMLGSEKEDDPLPIEEESSVGYEIMDWGDDSKDILAELSVTHYLITSARELELYNQSDASFQYNSCSGVVDCYLTEVSYYSTLYQETVYLYQTTYDSENHKYTPLSDSEYSENSKTVRKDYSEVKEYIENGKCVIKNTELFSTDNTTNMDRDATGEITFTADVDETAGKIYRPLTYTIVLVNKANHNSLRTMVKITQYPSKYIEYGPSQNVFVDGYFARLIPDDGYTITDESFPQGAKVNPKDASYYRSYAFVMSTYISGDSYYAPYYNYYYNNSDFPNTLYGSTSSSVSITEKLVTSYLILDYNTSSTNITFPYTVDVHVSAFTGKDNFFEVTSNSVKEQHTYIIGDPRQVGSFTSDQTHGATYVESGGELYDYLIGCSYSKPLSIIWGNHNTSPSYIRYVESWENAQNIKIGGLTSGHDNIIAPLFKIQSTYGVANYKVNFNIAQKRCATYQEAGYPAGRWRLPTLAEIAFVVSLQNKGVLNSMFTNSNGYWVSSGGSLLNNTSSGGTTGTGTIGTGTAATGTGTAATGTGAATGTSTGTGTSGSAGLNYTPAYTGTAFVRCVYDLWYWQDGDNDKQQHLPTHKYHPYPTLQK